LSKSHRWFPPPDRELAPVLQALREVFGPHNIRGWGWTPPQFGHRRDPGQHPGHVVQGLGNRTLMTKGRSRRGRSLEARGLVERLASPDDRRSTPVRLTPAGDRVFVEVFEPHLAFLAPDSSRCRKAGERNWKSACGSCARPLEKRSDESARKE